jgi:hypothetical protein
MASSPCLYVGEICLIGSCQPFFESESRFWFHAILKQAIAIHGNVIPRPCVKSSYLESVGDEANTMLSWLTTPIYTSWCCCASLSMSITAIHKFAAQSYAALVSHAANGSGRVPSEACSQKPFIVSHIESSS